MNRPALREELVQVAALCVATIEDIDYGMAQGHTKEILEDVHQERMRQEQLWGPRHYDPLQWLLLILEEVGESAEEARPWRNSSSKAIYVLIRQLVVLGNKAKRLLDSTKGIPKL